MTVLARGTGRDAAGRAVRIGEGKIEMESRRQAVIVLESSLTEHGYVPSVVTEGEPGHAPLAGQGEYAQPWYWGHDLEKAQKVAAEFNERMGLTTLDVQNIVLSSMRAQNERGR